MSQNKDRESLRFWRLVGVAFLGAIVLTTLYVWITSGVSKAQWSDALCTSALVLGIGSGIPFLLDAGRGLTLPGKMYGDADDRRATWDIERAKRERGMTVTFALTFTAVLIGLLSLLASLW